MKIILLKDIKGLGRKYDVKEIKDGYARNFLIPKRLAKIVTDMAVKKLEAQKAAQEKEEQETKIELEKIAKNLENQEFEFAVKTGEKGEVFGSVSKDDIRKATLASISNFHFYQEQIPGGFFPISNNIEVNLERPIKTLGEHRVEVDLGKGIKAKIKLKVLG